ncbi:MAG TPA: YncE family protein [Bryobacteraceae bacterium]
MKRLFAAVLVIAAAMAAEGYHVLTKIKIGGTGGWDYVTADATNHRLYVSHGSQVEVVDTEQGKVIGIVTDTPGVHGIALAHDFNKGFISSRGKNAAIAFDLKTFEKTGESKAGNNPDAICYEPKTKHVFAINHSGQDATAIDAKSGDVVATIPTGPQGEFCAVDGAGKVYVNLEASSELLEIDAAKNEVTRRMKLEPCDGPTGLAIDTKNKKLFAVCGNKMMAVVDIPSFKVVATPGIGAGPDAAAYDPGTGLAFSSNGEGTLTIVKLVNGKYEPVETVQTERGARTMAVDEKTHKIYLPAAEYGPAPEAKEGQKKGGRAPMLPDSFHLLVVGK